MATARLGHADLLLRDHDVAWRAIDLIGQSPLPRRSPSICRFGQHLFHDLFQNVKPGRNRANPNPTA